MSVTWVECPECHRSALDCDLTRETPQGLAHEFCDEPTWQKCTNCEQPVHLNHVEYTGADNTPWCAACNPEVHPQFGVIREVYPTSVDLAIQGDGCPCGICGTVTMMAELVPTSCTGSGSEFFTWHDRWDVYTNQSPSRAVTPTVIACGACMAQPENFMDGR
jgi:hypothetical protein